MQMGLLENFAILPNQIRWCSDAIFVQFIPYYIQSNGNFIIKLIKWANISSETHRIWLVTNSETMSSPIFNLTHSYNRFAYRFGPWLNDVCVVVSLQLLYHLD